MTDLSSWEVAERIRLADLHLTKFRLNDLAASNRFIDFNGQTVGSDSEWETLKTRNLETDVPDVFPVGQTNWLAVMSLIKSASISMSFPQLSVKCHEDPKQPEQPGQPKKAKKSEIVHKALKQFAKKGGWVRILTAALQKYDICGVGAIRYYYDPKWGPMIEHVTSNRMLIDHNCTNWSLLEWGGAHVQLSWRKMLLQYPRMKQELIGGASDDEMNSLDSSYEKISLYYEDDGEEVHIWNDGAQGEKDNTELYRGRNLYKRVPLCFMLGVSDPRGHMLPLGENVFATGMAQQVVDLYNNISSTAKNGGSLMMYSEPLLQPSTITALQNGQQQQAIGIKGTLTEGRLPIARLPSEEISQSVQIATQQAMAYLRAIVGVDASAAGQESQPGVTATQAIMAHARGAAMPTMVRTKFEELWAEVLTEVVRMVAEFGGKKKGEKVSTEQDLIHEAFESCYEVQVVPGSTSYQPLATDQQACLQAYTTIMQSLPAWEGQALRGVVDWVPNIQKHYLDLLQAFGRLEDEDYKTDAPPPPPPELSLPSDLMKALQTIYAKSPADVQAEILTKFGLKPSQMQQEGEGSELPENLLALAAEHGMQTQKERHELLKQQLDHNHTLQLETMRALHSNNGHSKE